MIGKLLRKIFGSRNVRALRRLQARVKEINAFEPTIHALSDAKLQAKTKEFRDRLANGAKLDDLLPEAFAVVREASQRVLNMRHFDVQLVGGMVLHQGDIAEMRTGEGKTVVATLPAYLNALTGYGVHIITVNDYLAQRDAEWMGPVYEFLGLTVGVVISDMEREAKKAAYAADIIFGTNNEFGFDYLRDNMAFDLDEKVQRSLHFAIVDEVDSILIDEARTPLIISGAADDSSELYQRINTLIPKLRQQAQNGDEGDFTLDEKTRQAYLTEAGHQKIEELLVEAGLLKAKESLYSAANIMLMHHINAALRAHKLYHRDIDYIVQNNEIVIVDEHTGRTMPGRRWSEGLHQAVEAKEGAHIQQENQTLASITFQNYFRQYDKLSGMTGTADTEAYEFQQIYALEVLVIPTNKPMIRDDRSDLVYLTQEEKFAEILTDIKDCRERGQPVLVGTASIETSEFVSNLLNKEKIAHQVLNAKFHAKEAQIIAEAGRPGVVTIATNMAGRGTDIVLGGNLEAELRALGEDATDKQKETLRQEWQQRHNDVIAAGGLHIIGTERHESRRIDNQLRGRAGRQGDPGSSRFYLSLEDNLMRIFASERIANLMGKLGMGKGEPIEHPWVNKAIENAQRKVEGYNFDVRKQLLEYDNVANDQRQIIYAERQQILAAENLRETIEDFRAEVFEQVITEHIPAQSLEEQWDVAGLEVQLSNDFGLQLPVQQWLKEDEGLHEEKLRDHILMEANTAYNTKIAQLGEEITCHLEQSITLQALDTHWREHLAALDHLRQGIHLRGYAQKDPKQEYKREAFALFHTMLGKIKYTIVSLLSTVEVQADEEVAALDEQRRLMDESLHFQHPGAGLPTLPESEMQSMLPTESEQQAATVSPVIREGRKVGRNEPCPCGSGRKFKHCHGQV